MVQLRWLGLWVCLLVVNPALFSHENPYCKTIDIPMRDGVALPTDIYLPHEEARGLPCILIRTPYGRTKHQSEFALFALEGYVVAIQDTRSCFSDGKTVPPYLTDGWGDLQDGYDTVEWLAESEWTNGKVGTCGISAQGITQLLLAPSAPPSLACQHIGVAAPSLFHHAIFNGGQFHKSQVEGWLSMHSNDVGAFALVFNQPHYNNFWELYDSVKSANKVNVPAIHFGGWFDVFSEGTIDAFVSRQNEGQANAKGHQKLVIGPWIHHWPQVEKLGDFEVPVEGKSAPVDFSVKRWFDYYLKGEDNGAKSLPPVTYYVMGPFDGSPSSGNVWKSADAWPIPARPTSFYLTKDHQLLRRQKPTKRTTLSYNYNPDAPCPTIGGRNLFLEAGPKDQTPLESRDDVLVFTSPPLQEDLEITGKIIAKIFFSSDQGDTDVVVRLTDVYPDGKSILITDGIRRLASLRDTLSKPGDFEKPQEVEIDLWSTSMVFAKGHRIRVSITSSNYPRFEKNPNTASPDLMIGASLVAKNQVHVGGNKLSRIILPIVKK